jgi:hypothetical protein
MLENYIKMGEKQMNSDENSTKQKLDFEIVLTMGNSIIYEIEVESITHILDGGKSRQDIEAPIEERKETGNFVYYERKSYNDINYLEQYDYVVDLAIKHNFKYVRLSLPCHICNNIDQFIYKAYRHLEGKYSLFNLKIYLAFYGCHEHNLTRLEEFSNTIGNQKGVSQSSGLLNLMNPYTSKRFSFRDWLNELVNNNPHIDILGIIPKETYSKMKKVQYLPSKMTLISIIIGFGLKINEAIELLNNTGFHLSPFIEYDQIIIESINHKRDIERTNKALLSIVSDNKNAKSYLSRCIYHKQLLGIKEDKVYLILSTIKPHVTKDEFNNLKNRLG